MYGRFDSTKDTYIPARVMGVTSVDKEAVKPASGSLFGNLFRGGASPLSNIFKGFRRRDGFDFDMGDIILLLILLLLFMEDDDSDWMIIIAAILILGI